uniref:UBC core domain-containing protein n=1 Tax=Aplanochytrium stocchinoi TaxID=215587 RepID=A0A7S3PFD0_9STRA|mmetsp:Transcript_30107/g.37119  ORF Transcript_30107/g.37119 Transcript_30107/m.37119 type:complete len:110 (+) Transcript_30107:261-590(+)
MAKRLAKEAAELAKQANEGDFDWGSAEPNEDNLFKWTACIAGPDNSPYEGGLFNIELNFPDNYPFKPPIVKFMTKVYHPSVKQDSGEICDDIIKASWKPTLNIRYLLHV